MSDSKVVRIGFVKLANTGSAPLEFLLDERAERQDIQVIVSSGAKMTPEDASEVTSKILDFGRASLWL